MSTLEFLVSLPLIAALAIALGAPARFTAIGASVLVFLTTIYCAINYNTSFEDFAAWQFESARTVFDMPGIPTISLAFGLDGISVVLILLSSIVLLAAVLAAPDESKVQGNSRLYYLSLLLIGGGALGAFTATDLFFFYAFHELALIPTFLMIGLFGRGENRIRTAWTITIFLSVGSLILLVGLILLVIKLGAQTFAIADLIELAQGQGIDAASQNWIFLLLLVGFGTLVSLFPFHSWAAPAYAEAPTPVTMLHAGVLKKFGLYGLIRIALPIVPEGFQHWLHLLLILLIGNILFIGLVTIAPRALDRMLGFSSVMHMGYIFLGIAAFNTMGVSGAVLLMFAHGLSIAALFALNGALRDRFGDLTFRRFGQLAKSLPRLGLLFGFATFAAIGLPGFANFAAEIPIYFGAFDGDASGMNWLRWATVGALWGVVISAVYLLRAYRSIFMGNAPKVRLDDAPDMLLREMLPVILLIAGLLIVGFSPEVLNQYIRPTVNGLFLLSAG